MQNFRALGAFLPNPQPPAAGGFAPRPPNSPPIANFWLRTWAHASQFKFLPTNLNVQAGRNSVFLF